MTEPRVRRGRSRQQAALDRVAKQMFDTYGYTDTHIAGIAREAGVSLSTFYSHFGSKVRAYREVMGMEPPLPDDDGEPGRALTARARRTRAALIAAARECFERDAYHAVRISDIAEQAGSAVGSFYTYFSSKQEIFTAVLNGALAELSQLRSEVPVPGPRPAVTREERRARAEERIRAAIEYYFDGFTLQATMALRVDEAVSMHPELMPLRLALHQASAERIAGSVRRWQEAGIADRGLDPEHTGHALAAMVGHSTRVWIAYGQEHDRATAIDTLVRLWVNGIGLAVATDASSG
ncbi:TetR/AcrR family transcriptional regulator [Pseudonocardia xinjiangensis]|uniref:TetR/AcrR family transcriptional regulator n=1 Tax=Pseudonocardia xinjiangensis TaxID=75289 RepID=UPI003D8D0133